MSTAVVTLVVGAALVAAGAWAYVSLVGHPVSSHVALATAGPLPPSSIASVDGSSSAPATAGALSATAGVDIEVPDLIGKPVRVAEALIAAAGLTVQTRVADPPAAGVAPDAVVSQYPAASALVPAGSGVVVTYQARIAGNGASPFVVVIDPGHQQKPDLGLEPIGPGSKQMKEKVAGGVTGIATGFPEYAQALAISLRLRDVLVAKGITVVMVRTTNPVDIPNSKRALIGNAAKADLVVRVHLNGSTDTSMTGIDTLYPAGNAWVKAIQAPSLRAARAVQAAAVGATRAMDRGTLGRSDMSGFNFSTRPSVLVECGYLSNPAEDRAIANAAYQQKLANGIAAGVMAFLQGN